MAQLTAAEITQLTAFATSGNRTAYWGLLAALGDKYASLALQVVEGNTLAGLIADYYAASYAAQRENSPPPAATTRGGLGRVRARTGCTAQGGGIRGGAVVARPPGCH